MKSTEPLGIGWKIKILKTGHCSLLCDKIKILASGFFARTLFTISAIIKDFPDPVGATINGRSYGNRACWFSLQTSNRAWTDSIWYGLAVNITKQII